MKINPDLCSICVPSVAGRIARASRPRSGKFLSDRWRNDYKFLMRRLAQPAVLKSAALAAIAGAALSYPRMALWPARAVPLWYVEAVLFLCGTVLWGFVFAWHEAYSQRPVFTLKIPPAVFAIATIAGVVVALGAHFLIDPALRTKVPDDYPRTYWQWTAMTLFDLAFVQLFLLFAPFA